MNIESNSGQIRVQSGNHSAGININSVLAGYGAQLEFWGGVAYLCKAEGTPFPLIVLVPSTEWESEVNAKYTIIASLTEFLKK